MLKLSLGLSLLTFLMIAAVTPPANAAVLGGKSGVPNVKTNREIQELGRYCVGQFNLQEQRKAENEESVSNTDTTVSNRLKFSRVVSAQKQVVAGTKYYLRIEVTRPDGSSKMFDSVLVIQPWIHSKKLLGFTPVASTN
ncbi:unnamed protein product [Cochlearia groenlandica]